VSATRTRVGGCATCAKADYPFADATRCAYCEAVLSPRHEHDHAPVPKRHGGKQTIPVCINCHDLKDRMNPRDWDAEAMREALADSAPLARILILRLFGDVLDLEADLDAARVG
jgi:hypothetical protein